MLIRSSVLTLSLLAPALAMAGGSLDMGLSNDSVAMEYDAAQVGSGLHISALGLHHETKGDVIGLGLSVVDVRNRQTNLYVGVGGRIYLFDQNDDESGALAIGGFARYFPAEMGGFGITGHVYYATKVISFNETENFIDTGLRLEYKVVPTAKVHFGYRFVQATEPGSREIELNAGYQFGLRVDF
ncbi:MAG: hypothetical protein H7A10_06505 [Oceanospirillaceae bacterium]|nr:hypothetical protein [Oceanospirillaceae bacterium]